MPGSQSIDQSAGERVLRRRVGADFGVEDGVGAALGERHHPSLGERGLLALVHSRTPEPRVVLRRVGHIQTGPVDRHQPPPRQPRPRRRHARQRPSDPANSASTGSEPNRCRAWKIADFDGNSTGSVARRPRQTVGQQRQHVLIGALRVQRHPDREVRHHPSRQRPMPLLGPARLGDHLIDQRRREHPRQHPHRHQIRQPPLRLRLHSNPHEAPTKLHRCSLN